VEKISLKVAVKMSFPQWGKTTFSTALGKTKKSRFNPIISQISNVEKIVNKSNFDLVIYLLTDTIKSLIIM